MEANQTSDGAESATIQETTEQPSTKQSSLDDISLETLLENENIRKQLEELTEKYSEKLRNEKRKVQDNFYELQTKYAKLLEKGAQSERDIEESNEKLENKKQELLMSETNCQELETRIHELNGEITNLGLELDDKTESIERLEHMCSDYKEQNETLTNDLNNWRDMYENLSKKNDFDSHGFEFIFDNDDNKNEFIDNMMNDLYYNNSNKNENLIKTDKKSNGKDNDNDNSNRNDNDSTLENDSKSRSINKATLYEIFKQFEHKMELKSKEYNNILNRLGNVENRQLQTDNENNGLKSDLALLETKYNELNSQFNQLNIKYNEARNENRHLASELESQNENSKHLNEHIAKLQNQISQLEEKNASLTDDLAKYEKSELPLANGHGKSKGHGSTETINLEQFIVENEYNIKFYPNPTQRRRNSSISSNHSYHSRDSLSDLYHDGVSTHGTNSRRNSGKHWNNDELLAQEDYNFIKEINNSSNRTPNHNVNNDNSNQENDDTNETSTDNNDQNKENKNENENENGNNNNKKNKNKNSSKNKVNVGLNLDAEQEFFYLTFFACKILLATQGISHEILTDIDKLDLWNECQENYVSMHEFHDWIKNKLTRQYLEIKEMEKNEKQLNENKSNNNNDNDDRNEQNEMMRPRKISHFWSSKDSIVEINKKKEQDLKQINQQLQSRESPENMDSIHRYKDNYDRL